MGSKFIFKSYAGVAAVFLVSLSFASASFVETMRVMNLDKGGKFENCGTVPFNATWSPDPISPSQPLKITVDYTFPEDVDGGKYNLTIWFHGDSEPFLEFADYFSCKDISKYVPCPASKGFHFHVMKAFDHIPNVGSYPGDYDVRAEAKTKSGHDLFCMKAHILILKV